MKEHISSPPIPDPLLAPIERGPRPPALKYFMVGTLLFSVIGLIYCDGSMTQISVMADLITYFLITVLWLVVLWFCWVGHNWARIVAMIGCALTVASIFLMAEYTTLQKVVAVTDMIFSAVWFWWLRSPAMVAFSKGEQ